MSVEVPQQRVVIAAMYHFAHLADFQSLKEPLLALCAEHGVKGTVLLAEEGINATIAASRDGIDHFLQFLRADPRLAALTHKESYADEVPFHRIKVRLKKEIVTMGVPNTDPNEINGTRVTAQQWNELIADPEVLVLDTRNKYEHEIGTFDNALSPCTETFREFPTFVDNELDPQTH